MKAKEIKKIDNDIWVKWEGSKKFVKCDNPEIAAYIIFSMLD